MSAFFGSIGELSHAQHSPSCPRSSLHIRAQAPASTSGKLRKSMIDSDLGSPCSLKLSRCIVWYRRNRSPACACCEGGKGGESSLLVYTSTLYLEDGSHPCVAQRVSTWHFRAEP